MVLFRGINDESHTSGWQTALSFVCLLVNYWTSFSSKAGTRKRVVEQEAEYCKKETYLTKSVQ
jgi:hypothetical protein